MVFFETESKVERSYVTIENPQVIGEHLKKRRQELKLRQKDVAQTLGVTDDCIGNWEVGFSYPHVSYFPALFRFLGYMPFQLDETTLAGRMKAYRIRYGLTQEDLGKLVGVNESTIFHWENGTHSPLPSKLKLLDRILNQKELP